MSTPKVKYREPFELPILHPKSRRAILEKYAALTWRIVELKDVAIALDGLYEEAYSNGLRHSDLAHEATDK